MDQKQTNRELASLRKEIVLFILFEGFARPLPIS